MESQSSVPAGYEHRWRGMIFIGISLAVISIDNTILNVALPSISNAMGATASDLQWIVDAYVLVFAALLLTTGSLGDRVGRKRTLIAGLILFGIGSFAAAISTSTTMLIAARAFLGIGGAMIMPSTLSLISATFPPQERIQAISIWSAIFALGVGIGPVIGGFLLTHFEWGSVFLVNLPVVAVAAIGGVKFLSESRDESAPAVDIPGVVLSIIGLFALVYAIIEAGFLGWSDPTVTNAFIIAAIFLAAFAAWESYAPNAMLPMSLFRNMGFTAANMMLTLFAFAMFGSMFFFSQYFQTVQNVPIFESGLRVLPNAIILTFMATQSPKLVARVGIKKSIALGAVIAAAGMFYMSQMFHVETPYSLIVIGQIILAVGLGIAFSPATTSVMNSVPMSKAGIGSAMNDTTRQLGGALGVAILGTVATNSYLNGIAPLQSLVSEDAFATISSSIQAAHGLVTHNLVASDVSASIIDVTNTAFVSGMNNAMLISSVMMLMGAVLIMMLLPSKTARGADVSSEVAAASVGD